LLKHLKQHGRTHKRDYIIPWIIIVHRGCACYQYIPV
jgi:hypothetical protein